MKLFNIHFTAAMVGLLLSISANAMNQGQGQGCPNSQTQGKGQVQAAQKVAQQFCDQNPACQTAQKEVVLVLDPVPTPQVNHSCSSSSDSSSD